jgi:hypothetical protein
VKCDDASRCGLTEMLANSSSIHEVLTELANDAESPEASSEASASSIADSYGPCSLYTSLQGRFISLAEAQTASPFDLLGFVELLTSLSPRERLNTFADLSVRLQICEASGRRVYWQLRYEILAPCAGLRPACVLRQDDPEWWQVAPEF